MSGDTDRKSAHVHGTRELNTDLDVRWIEMFQEARKSKCFWKTISATCTRLDWPPIFSLSFYDIPHYM